MVFSNKKFYIYFFLLFVGLASIRFFPNIQKVLTNKSYSFTQASAASDNVWLTPISSNAAIDPNSESMIATILVPITSDTEQYTYPVYHIGKTTGRYNVPCLKYKCTVVEKETEKVTRVTSLNIPIPRDAKPSAGADRQMIVIDRENGKEYGLYHAYKLSDGSWIASNAYEYPLSGSYATPRFGSRGAGIPYLAGLIRPYEIKNGAIQHALAFGYPATAATKCVFPASKTDGTSTQKYAIPEGARLQLNPRLTDADFETMGLTRAGKIVAKALQTYGMFLIDTSGAPKLYAENLIVNSYTLYAWNSLDINYTKKVISGIPLKHFRVLDLPNSYWSQESAPNFGNCWK